MVKNGWKMGRKLCVYTPEIGDEILERVANGESLNQICKSEHIPSRATVWDWRHANQEFGSKYEMAVQCSEEYYCDLILEAAQDETLTDSIRRAKMDAYKWTSSRRRGGSKSPKEETTLVTEADLRAALEDLENTMREGK